MTTAATPAGLIRDARDALTAARAAEAFLTAHPSLQPERMHACGADGSGGHGPLLELQLPDNSVEALTCWARQAEAEVSQEPFLSYAQHRAETRIGDVTVWVTTYEKAGDDEDADAS